jgi:hypothetical protein
VRITTDGLTKERAIDIYEWLLDQRANMFFEQLKKTEAQAFERILKDSDKSFDIVPVIKAMREIPNYIEYLKDFISEGVARDENVKIIVDT